VEKDNLKNMDILRLILLVMLLTSCSNRTPTTNDDIDSFILKYENENFTIFKGVSISFRDRDTKEYIYMVAKQGGNFPCYVVHYSKSKNKVINIDDKLLQQRNVTSYFSESKINELMQKFITYNVQNLSVDSNENVFISPFFGENSPALLRLSKSTNEKEIKKGTIYKLYKEYWYISK
jgi:hypothetical protein